MQRGRAGAVARVCRSAAWFTKCMILSTVCGVPRVVQSLYTYGNLICKSPEGMVKSRGGCPERRQREARRRAFGGTRQPVAREGGALDGLERFERLWEQFMELDEKTAGDAPVASRHTDEGFSLLRGSHKGGGQSGHPVQPGFQGRAFGGAQGRGHPLASLSRTCMNGAGRLSGVSWHYGRFTASIYK